MDSHVHSPSLDPYVDDESSSYVDDYGSYVDEYGSYADADVDSYIDDVTTEQITQISILLEWFVVSLRLNTKESSIINLKSTFKDITEILYLTKRDIKMVRRYYRYLHGRITDSEQFYTTPQIILCTEVYDSLNLAIKSHYH